MAELTNSRRTILKATHTPILVTEQEREVLRGPMKRSLLLHTAQDKPVHGALDRLAVSTAHADAIRQVVASAGSDPGAELSALATVPAGVLLDLAERVGADSAQLAAFRASLGVEPIGYLHLEKLAFTPVGVERGELVYSVPLAPAEQVNITFREWSNTSQEFERLETDTLDEFSEEGVTEKSELQQSTENQYQHTTELSASVNISGTYGGVSFAAGGSASATDSASRSEEFTRSQSRTVTKKASRRAVQEHKLSFRVASASGTQNESVKRFRNPHRDKALRIDYYRMMRKWSVDLLRYGIRLTYDLVIPEPGSELLDRIIEIRAIEAALKAGFGADDGPDWARFPLKPNELTRAGYPDKAALYGAVVEPPPTETKSVNAADSRTFSSFDESQRGGAYAVVVDADTLYTVTDVLATSNGFEWPGYQTQFNRDKTIVDNGYAGPFVLGRSGSVAVPYSVRYAASYAVTISLTLTLKDEAFRAWQNKAWSTIRDAAERRYYEQRTALQQRLAELTEQLAANDTLTLRRMEREEMMKHVLRWLIGPPFTTYSGTKDYYDSTTGAVKDDATWRTGLARGATIRFLQEAVEWENLLYIVYPYFWSGLKGAEFRKFLDHPDPLHRAFLRSGAARVVMTIRPGFVEPFLAFVAGTPVPPAPYVTIAQELEAFANTNYPGIQPANAVEDARPLLLPKQKAAWADMQLLTLLLGDYRKQNGSYPTTSQGLKALAAVAKARNVTLPLKDPWETPYEYASPGVHGDYDLSSLGANRKPGGEGADSDLTSWAEGALIGQWYEYTPTSAIDIAVGAPPGP
ncbi:type II secretion system protein GspG [Streptomyces sp. NBC_01304]|uniref:type II secretion system protein GspG n=1 Tax=Streptomyces sp. NBC_01304 TaxID=2903818 RepID=UPI002E0D6A91|nr:type II secretion system protein GspG [Streptomyces sp. NBC_01304]